MDMKLKLLLTAGLLVSPALLQVQLARAQSACAPVTYEAENMAHSTGGSTPGGWNIWANGNISTNHSFDGGSKVITVVARGQAAAGVAAHMEVNVDGWASSYSYSVVPSAWSTYTMNVEVPSGTRQIRVSFTNDYNQNGQDRNLYIDKVIVGCGGGWTNLSLRDGWKPARGSGVPAVGLIDGIVTFRGGLDGTSATSDVPFCLTDGHGAPGPDYTQYRATDVGFDLHTRAALANGATGTLQVHPLSRQTDPDLPETEVSNSYCVRVAEDGVGAAMGPNAMAFTSLDGVTYTKSAYGAQGGNAVRVSAVGDAWDVDYPWRGTDGFILPDGQGVYAKPVNGFVRFEGAVKYRGPQPAPALLFNLRSDLRPSSTVYLPVALSPLNPSPGQIVIQPNGDVMVEGALDAAAAGISLDGTAYSVSQADGSPLATLNWSPASSRLVRARLANGVVRLEGAVQNGASATIGTLPQSMIPAQTVYVVADAPVLAQPATLRIDPSGAIVVVSPALGLAQSGISLDGVSFALDGSFQCTGGCTSATPLTRFQNSGPFNTLGERWFVVNESINGWQASENTGRTIRVNGVVATPGQMPLPPPVNGTTYYFQFSAGTKPWASWSFW
jgi:hypothetical protein